MNEAEDWAVIVRAKNQEIQKWQQQALELSNLVAPLRDEVARLTAFVKKVGHPQWCPGFMTNNSDACTCGYYAIIPPAKAALTQGKGGVNG